jgi:nitrite reductase (NADH) small subunit
LKAQVRLVLAGTENNFFQPRFASGFRWVEVCRVEDILPGTGVTALIDGEQIAIVRSTDGSSVYAISNFDPFSKAFVIARGIVGDRSGTPKIASPIYKQNFDLRTGQCLDQPDVQLTVYPVRIAKRKILLGVKARQ